MSNPSNHGGASRDSIGLQSGVRDCSRSISLAISTDNAINRDLRCSCSTGLPTVDLSDLPPDEEPARLMEGR